VVAREENRGERHWKAAAKNDKPQLIRDPKNRRLRLLSKS
jgi:hypothetical protein